MTQKKILIAGNPNSGKSTLFNNLTGRRQKVGNWPGVTVEKVSGEIHTSTGKMEIIDLPGIYSLSAFSEDERIAKNSLLHDRPDLIINVVDSLNLERNLYFTHQLLELGLPVLLVLNMRDLAEKAGIELNPDLLSLRLGLPVLAVSSKSTRDMEKLKEAIETYLTNLSNTAKNSTLTENPLSHPPTDTVKKSSDTWITSTSFTSKNNLEIFPQELREEVELLEHSVQSIAIEMDIPASWVALKILEGDPDLTQKIISQGIPGELLEDAKERVKRQLGKFPDEVLASVRFERISQWVQGAIRRPKEIETPSDYIDKIVLNKFLCFPIFLFTMYLVFWFTMNVGGAFIDFFDLAGGVIFVDSIRFILEKLGAPSVLQVILADGIGAGIQTLGTFIPILFSLFVMISFLENSGYMARAAFIMDRFMRSIGLPGKAFIPLLVGFGCTVPAITATRTLENKKDRILTVFMSPFMSCGAKMPVYALFAAAFYSTHGQNIVFLLYFIGVLLAIFTGLLLKTTVFKGSVSPFIMELPSYHAPRFKDLIYGASIRLKSFLKKAGKVLIPIVAVLGILNSLGPDGSFGNENTEKSVLTKAGQTLTPIFTPMGIEKDNWQATVGIFTGLFAKEIIVGTLNSLYITSANQNFAVSEYKPGEGLLAAVQSIPAQFASLGHSLLDPLGLSTLESSTQEEASKNMAVDAEVFSVMQTKFTHGGLGAFAFLLFVLLYVPCITAFSSAWKEMGSALALLLLIYSTGLAWVVGVMYFQIAVGHSWFWIGFALTFFALMVSGIIVFARTNGQLFESQMAGYKGLKGKC